MAIQIKAINICGEEDQRSNGKKYFQFVTLFNQDKYAKVMLYNQTNRKLVLSLLYTDHYRPQGTVGYLSLGTESGPRAGYFHI